MNRDAQEFLEIMDMPVFEEYQFWELLKERKILLNKQVDDTIVERVIIQILKWNDEDEGKEASKRQPIILYLNTPGGHVDIGLVLCNVIKQSKTPVHIVTLALACSMGALILMSGHKRFAYPFSNVLIHDGSTFLGGTTSKVRDTMKYYEEKEEQIKEFILANTAIKEEVYEGKYKAEWWMTAKSAKEFGVIDYIIGVDNVSITAV